MSTFRHFRKHSKAFFAVASVLAIGLFVFGRSTGGGGPKNNGQAQASNLVATWNGGSINEGQLQSLLNQRVLTNRFLRMLFMQGGGESEYDLPQGVPNFVVSEENTQQLMEEVVLTDMYASLATAAGMSVSDTMINHYIQEFGLDRVDTAGVSGILGEAGSGSARTNEAIVFATLRKLLLSHFYLHSYDDAAASVLPEQRWEDWRRVNEKISLEAAILPVEDFLDATPKPTEAQLKALYDKFRDQEPDLVYNVMLRELPSPDPGFAEPRRVKLQYLVGNVAERTQTLLASITDAEISEYYEHNKRTEFVKTDDEFGLGDDAAPGDNAASGDAAPSGETPAAEAAGEDAPAADDAAAPAAEGDKETPAEPATPAAGADAPAAPAATPAEPAAGADAPATSDAPAAPAAAPAGGAEPAATGGEQSSAARRSPFRLTALQTAPATAAAAADAPATDAPADAPAADAPAADAAETEAAETDTPAADGAAADAPAADVPADDAASDATAAADSNAEDKKPADSEAAAKEAPVEYVPLDEVREQIREALAREMAVDQLQTQIGEASAKLQSEYNQYGRLVVENRVAKKAAPKPPAKLADLKWLADEYGLKLEPTTDALSLSQLFELPVGKAVDDQAGRINVAQAEFTSLNLYEPFVAKELEGDWYLVIKTEDTPRRVPEFAEVRDKVAAAWKRIEAGKLAEKKAEELAKESEKASESFQDFFEAKGFKVVAQTALFSWRNYSLGAGMGYPAELSEVPELKNVGPDFMQAAFALGDKEVKTMLNFDKSAAYVFRLHARQYTPDELKKLFLKEANTWLGARDMQGEHFNQFRGVVYPTIRKEIADFKFDEDWVKRRQEQLAERD